MYRNNEHFGDNRDPISNPPPPLYPPRRDMHHMDTFSNSLPLYYDMNPPPYEYLPQVQEGYDACYNWRDGNDLKRHHMLPQQQMQSQQMQSQMQSIQGHYGHQSPYYGSASAKQGDSFGQTGQSQSNQSVMTGEGNTGTRMIGGQLVGSQMVGNQMVGNPIVGPSMVGPPLGAPLGQLNIVQRMSMIIKSQLPVLQATMIIVETKRLYYKGRTERSRSRSRDRPRKPPGCTMEWLCQKCSFSNFDFRDKCRKCNEPRSETVKTYIPNPDDWRCPKCNNINYARRSECNRCHLPRYK